ncbi:prepilin-type N-terminal cleavage/methylation domain-containing protein [Vibrio tapetis subsp. quintayensis]|uniref:prepilin-type N-terminal cleavage/methylation domain-containing protein n=1 Tax=Vibrio tapetis TaxID=52443 RepID=UPI0025B41846|nr:prepilin-type N-terminal cleavage/methylation domain-containing protein [Vibrio tapetis]MDN3680232.1 prepilin-type N-terminal cleavage/methylation domain-containing protein [Vibrio tapetis subsp. quintayensis]
MYKRQGFTIIELVIVVVILGVVAVTALPKYLSIQSDATSSVVKGIASSFRIVVEQVNYKAIVQGKDKQRSVQVDVGGVMINTYFGTPQELWDGAIASIMNSDIAYLGNGYYTPDSLTTPCTGAPICVVDQTQANKVLPGYAGWGMFFVPRGRTVADNCLAYYVFSEDGTKVTFKETSWRVDGC